jgi:hypothetical protein
MNYIKVRWIHDHPDEPIWLLSELDGSGYEIRKIEIFGDGSKGWASKKEKVGGTVLGERPVPPLDEIAADGKFLPEEITQADFELAWTWRRLPDKSN